MPLILSELAPRRFLPLLLVLVGLLAFSLTISRASAQNLTGPGNALIFNGTSSYLRCGTSNRGITQQVTAEAWVKTTDGSYQWLVAKYYNSLLEERGFHLYINNGTAGFNGRLGVGVYMSSGPSSTPVSDGRWHHLVGVCNFSTWQIYVDGMLENSATYATTRSDLTTSTNLVIGNYDVQNAQYFNGQLDEVRLWRTARTATEIRNNMCRKFITAPADLVAYYRLDHASGFVANDQGSQPAPGTLQNFGGTPWRTSGAPVGDASRYLYPPAAWPANGRVGIMAASGDSAIVQGLPASTRGVQLYVVNSAPSIPAGAGAAATYFGAFSVGSRTGSPTSYALRVRPLAGAACRTLAQRGANDQPWAPASSTASATSLVIGPALLFYRGEYIVAGSAGAVPVSIAGDSVLCPGRAGQLTATAGSGATFRWNTGAAAAAIALTQAGTYTVTATYGGGCAQQASYRVRAAQAAPAFAFGPDTTLCEGQTLTLRAPGGPGLRYLWSDGSTGPQLVMRTPGLYTLRVTAECSQQSAARTVAVRNCLRIPNIITPNGDKVNDVFAVEGLFGDDWTLDVFNRWGRAIQHSPSYHNDWGKEAAPGVYYILLQRASDGYKYKGWLEVVP